MQRPVIGACLYVGNLSLRNRPSSYGMSQIDLATSLLVVADKPAAREELAAALEPVTSARVTETGSVPAAISALQAVDRQIDLVIVDLELSASGAVTLTRKIRDAQTLGPQSIAILLIGGAPSTPQYQAAARLGIQGYLPRPFTASQLRAALRAALAARAVEPVRVQPVSVDRETKTEVRHVPTGPTLDEALLNAVPLANKPFRYGLQSLMRATMPLTDDECFGFGPAPQSVRPRPMRTEPESLPMIGGMFVAVA